jgi:hypothetical protein
MVSQLRISPELSEGTKGFAVHSPAGTVGMGSPASWLWWVGCTEGFKTGEVVVDGRF